MHFPFFTAADLWEPSVWFAALGADSDLLMDHPPKRLQRDAYVLLQRPTERKWYCAKDGKRSRAPSINGRRRISAKLSFNEDRRVICRNGTVCMIFRESGASRLVLGVQVPSNLFNTRSSELSNTTYIFKTLSFGIPDYSFPLCSNAIRD